ncbi:aminopeptidase 2 [Nemania diffusa]|nr:aminopeptidase 2 [Nemania diffusa]
MASRKLLPAHLKPTLYRVRLEPNFDGKCFSGQVDISCLVVEATRVVKLHCKYISITAVTIESHSIKQSVDVSLIRYQESEETVEIEASEQFIVGENPKFVIEYCGKFTNDLAGFYQAHYTTDEDETEHHIAVTSMEPTYARQVFPCFDEPALKAKFVMSIVAHPSWLSFSNTPIDKVTELSESKQLVVFQKTPQMSTYLVAVMAGPLAQVKSTKSNFPLSIVCPLGSEAEADYALNLAWEGLCLFSQMFNSPYPLSKLDLAAVPDFSAGAMENWGLITFRTNALLLDVDDSSLERKQYIANTVLHEIAHMWFGNLVTMKYWDGLWLKEGFATLMAWMASDKLYPSWRIWDNYVLRDLQAALELDSLSNTHAVEQVVQDATEAKQIYDEISYQKGCCILKMVSHELGEDRFLEGVRLYIERHSFGNTESKDLWLAWEDLTGQPFQDKMRVWTKQAGFPLIKVKQLTFQDEVQDEGSTLAHSLCLSQERFIGGAATNLAEDQMGPYPLRIAIRFDSGVRVVDMATRELSIRLPPSEFVKVNADHDGVFRTFYEPDHLQRLIQAALKGHLSIRDAVGMSCDLRALVSAGTNKTSTLLDLCLSFKNMSDYCVWETIDKNLRAVQSTFKFQSPAVIIALKKVIVNIIGSKSRQLGWDISEEDDESMVSFKASMFSGAGLAGDPEIVSAAKEMFAERVAGKENAINPSLWWETFGIVAAYGGREELEALLNIWKSSSNEDEKYLALECLGRASTAELIEWVLDLAFTKQVKDQDLYLLLWLMNSSTHGAEGLWKWAKTNWDRVEKAVPVDMQSMTLGVVLDGLSTKDQMADVERYFAERNAENYQQLLARKMEHMDIRRLWAERDLEDLTSWLGTHGYMD